MTEKDFGQILKFKEENNMSMINQTSASDVMSYSTSQANQAQKADRVSEDTGKRSVSGKKIGDPKLSEEGAKYYEELKKKYSGMDFILVSADQKEQAKAQAGRYANPNRMVVLIDEEKIERMATDENFRKQYEAVIANASSKMSSLSANMAKTGANVKTYGIQVNDNGTASYFAVLDKANKAQRERITQRAEQKRSDKKEADKKAREERLEKAHGRGKEKDVEDRWEKDTVTVSAGSMEELMQKIEDMQMAMWSDQVLTEEEKKHGQNIDYSL